MSDERQAKIEAMRERVRENIAAKQREKASTTYTPPRYDDVFFAGVAALNAEHDSPGLLETVVTLPQHTYPLYCVDRQDRVSPEHQYRGPFATHDEAHEQAEPGDLVRRCRRVRATEIHGWETVLGDLMEQLDERATSGDLPDGAWGDFGDTIVEGQRDNLVDAMRALLDEHVRVDAYICEGDE